MSSRLLQGNTGAPIEDFIVEAFPGTLLENGHLTVLEEPQFKHIPIVHVKVLTSSADSQLGVEVFLTDAVHTVTVLLVE